MVFVEEVVGDNDGDDDEGIVEMTPEVSVCVCVTWFVCGILHTGCLVSCDNIWRGSTRDIIFVKYYLSLANCDLNGERQKCVEPRRV